MLVPGPGNFARTSREPLADALKPSLDGFFSSSRPGSTYEGTEAEKAAFNKTSFNKFSSRPGSTWEEQQHQQQQGQGPNAKPAAANQKKSQFGRTSAGAGMCGGPMLIPEPGFARTSREPFLEALKPDFKAFAEVFSPFTSRPGSKMEGGSAEETLPMSDGRPGSTMP